MAEKLTSTKPSVIKTFLESFIHSVTGMTNRTEFCCHFLFFGGGFAGFKVDLMHSFKTVTLTGLQFPASVAQPKAHYLIQPSYETYSEG